MHIGVKMNELEERIIELEKQNEILKKLIVKLLKQRDKRKEIKEDLGFC